MSIEEGVSIPGWPLQRILAMAGVGAMLAAILWGGSLALGDLGKVVVIELLAVLTVLGFFPALFGLLRSAGRIAIAPGTVRIWGVWGEREFALTDLTVLQRGHLLGSKVLQARSPSKKGPASRKNLWVTVNQADAIERALASA